MHLSDRFDSALAWATELHRQQRRKGTEIPYISHPLAVASLVLEHGGSEEEAIGALLHDAVEDSEVTVDEVRRRFGDAVALIVDGCTDADVTPKPPWRPRKQAYLAHLPQAPPSVRLVSAADKLHNLRAITADYRRVGEALWSRFRGGKDGTLWYYRELSATFSGHGPAPLAELLRATLDELEQLLER